MPSPLLVEVPQEIETERLFLRVPRAGDGPALHEAVSESLVELRRFIASVPWVAQEQSAESSEIYCRTALSNFVARKDMPYLLFERESSRLVGCAGLHRPNWDMPRFEVGYWCRAASVGNGFITEAVSALVHLAEARLSAVRLELITDAENTRSRAVADRAGFHLEGVLRNERRAPDGSLRNTCVYARVRSAA